MINTSKTNLVHWLKAGYNTYGLTKHLNPKVNVCSNGLLVSPPQTIQTRALTKHFLDEKGNPLHVRLNRLKVLLCYNKM